MLLRLLSRKFAVPAVKITMENTPAGRYAYTLFMTALDLEKHVEVKEDMEYLRELWETSEDFQSLCRDPTVSSPTVKEIVSSISDGFCDIS